MLAIKLQMTALRRALSVLDQLSMMMELQEELLFQVGSLSHLQAAAYRQLQSTLLMAASTVLTPCSLLGLQLMVILSLTRPSHSL